MLTKIICTIGPACDSPATLRRLIAAGMDVARFNFSHSTHAEHLKRMNRVRAAAKAARKPVALLQDLEGYRIRVGRLKAPVELRKGTRFFLSRRAGDARAVPFDYAGPLNVIPLKSLVYIDDGNIALRVVGHEKHALRVEVIVPGLLKERKGINIPNFLIPFTGMTPKDSVDLRFGLDQRVDMVALSFVRSRLDVDQVRKLAGKACPKIISKIENAEGVCNIDEIVSASEGVMIARGDLGVSLPIHEIPMIQKLIIAKCRKKNKFSVTATQMLESMTENLRPTRAEVSDVANAILDGSNYVMLSGETAVGQYPVETVQMMRRISDYTKTYDSARETHAHYCRI